jgi:hypothetical protein
MEAALWLALWRPRQVVTSYSWASCRLLKQDWEGQAVGDLQGVFWELQVIAYQALECRDLGELPPPVAAAATARPTTCLGW